MEDFNIFLASKTSLPVDINPPIAACDATLLHPPETLNAFL